MKLKELDEGYKKLKLETLVANCLNWNEHYKEYYFLDQPKEVKKVNEVKDELIKLVGEKKLIKILNILNDPWV